MEERRKRLRVYLAASKEDLDDLGRAVCEGDDFEDLEAQFVGEVAEGGRQFDCRLCARRIELVSAIGVSARCWARCGSTRGKSRQGTRFDARLTR